MVKKHKRIKRKVNHIAHHAIAAPAEVVHLVVHGVGRAHHVLVHRPHQRIRQRVGWYDRWHNHRHHHKVHVGIFAMYIGMSLIAMIGFTRVAGAFDQFVQADWSGGVGSSTVNQYAEADNTVPAAGSVSIGASDHANWCNTPNCDTNWTARKLITVKNTASQTFTNYQAKITITTDTGMQSDFRDLRFTNEAGDTDYSHFLAHDYNGQSADVYVKIPSLPQGSTNLYVYFGNANANSVSDVNNTMLFADHFNELSGNNGNPYWYGCNETDFNGGVATTGPACNLTAQSPYYQYSLSDTDLVTEFDYRQDFSSLNDCSQGSPGNYFKLTVNSAAPNDQITVGTNLVPDQNNCGANAKWYVSTVNIAGFEGDPNLSAYFAPQNSPQFSQSAYVRFRLINRLSGGVELYYSTDNGANYSQIGPLFPNNTQQFDSALLFSTDWRQIQIRNLYLYARSTAVSSQTGVYQWQAGRYGTLTSSVIDMGANAFYGNLNYDSSGSGIKTVRIRTSASSDMSGATDFRYCSNMTSGDAITSSSCYGIGQQYMQYQIVLSDDGTHDAAVSSVTIEHGNDSTGPNILSSINMNRFNGGQSLANNAWVNQKPYLSWSAATDNIGGSGVGGYCIGLTQNTTTPDGLTKDMIGDPSPLNTGGACEYAISGTSLDLAAISSMASLSNGTTYYVGVRPIDNSGNLASAATVISFRYDNDDPTLATIVTPPKAVTNSKIVSATWLPMAPSFDATSGIAGFKYCVARLIDGFSGCGENDNNWYGKNHTSGQASDTSDVFPYTDGTLSTAVADAARLDDSIAGGGLFGINGMIIALVDNAGNIINSGPPGFIFTITYQAAGAATNLQVTPSSNSTNDFAFTWDPPAMSFGGTGTINYCWSVNTPIAADGSNCNWTGEGITQLASGAYATKQGVNTMYVSSRDLSGNFDGTQYASVTFSASTVAPGPPQNLDVSDISIRATSAWKLALSWNEATQPGAGIASYRVYRSTDNVNFTQVGSTSPTNLSFIDSGLSQVLYYYQVKACDDAGSCSVASNTVSKKPSGRFTSPANLTADTNQPRAENIGNRRATIVWFTDRESDSKVSIGKNPGQYATEEVGSSAQVTNHSVTLSNLQPGTTYYFVTKWTDEDGNTGISKEVSFTTLPAPLVKEITTTQINVDKATTNFTVKAASQAIIYYGKSDGFGGVKKINTSANESTYSVVLDGLDDGTKYFYKINSVDADGNEYEGNTNSFTTLARPRISNLSLRPVAGEPSSTLKISWDTNVPASTEIVYGPKGQKQAEELSSGRTTSHEIVVRGLLDDSDYTLVARSRDEFGNTAVSDEQNFRTALDTRSPKISDISVEVAVKGSGSEARGQIVVSWKTDEPATSAVAYGVGNSGNFTSRTAEDDKLTTDHVVVISDLSPSNVYQVQPLSRDRAKNLTQGEAQSAIVGRATDSVLSIIFNALRRIFGFSS
ncbi:DUF2341 domain-containing protein [bacterium]|nr:DUF2341 domain-containing protein [bacterium]